MHKFKEYKELDLVEISNSILSYWDNNETFIKSITNKNPNDSFVFYEGPPSANGLPGIHHVMARTIKDIFCRYQTLNGKKVIRKAGWDTHGLPVELGVEKELNITKEDIGKSISIEDYNLACKNAVLKYTDVWNDLTKKMGYWVDLTDPYITYKSKYIESVWWLLKEIYKKKLFYKGYSIQPYSPKAGTGISSHELNLPGTYKEVTDTTIVAQFKLIKNSCKLLENINGDIFFLAWTTTPWTLPSNTALTVGKNIEYVLVKTFNQYTFLPTKVILAKKLIQKNFSDKTFVKTENIDGLNSFNNVEKIPYLVEKEFLGLEILNAKYEQLLNWAIPIDNKEKAFVVISGDFVTTEDGTGIVHTAPTFGADDAKVAKENNIPPLLVLDSNNNKVPLVNLQGKFIDNLPKNYAGKYVKNEFYEEGTAPNRSVDVEIAIELKEQNKAFKVEKYKHNYPHCWRTDKPILYYPLDSWFIKIETVRERMVTLNNTINWKPKSTGEGRFGNWLENAIDWNLSRSRYWGIPLPIWRTETGVEEKVIGSIEELINEINLSISAGNMQKNPFSDFEINNFNEENYNLVDLHKNIVDDIILTSEKGIPMKRESDLIDVWFDSGAMPYAQWHYPFENKELIDNQKLFPADFIAEGVDQTRGWFYTLHVISTLVFDKVAFKNVISNGLVLDKFGQKMSKRLGNSTNPFEVLAKYGADATRWYMISNASPWENLKFDVEGIDEIKRKLFGTLYNTYSFFVIYANIDNFNYSEEDILIEKRSELDRWILSELNNLVSNVNEFYKDYESTKAARAIQTFITDNLSNWYVRLNRRRFWKGEYSEDKISAYQTLYTCLITIAKISCPIAPFFMDRLYQDLNQVTKKEPFDSVHLSDFPKSNANLINVSLQEEMELAQKITSLVFSLRKKENIKVRQPLQKMMISVFDEKTRNQIQKISNLIKQEVNIKEIILLNNKESSEILVKKVTPSFKLLGPKLGNKLKFVSEKLANLTADQISLLESTEKITIEIEQTAYDFEIKDFEITTKDIPGWLVQSSGKITIALDINISVALENEGISREIVNKIQNLRKDNNFEVSDRINVTFETTSKIKEAINENKKYICQETLSENIIFTNSIETENEFNILNKKIKILINKV
ncbi:MAG: isoleucine--tRNA ligase [Solirubrobacteraceae bacterium]